MEALTSFQKKIISKIKVEDDSIAIIGFHEGISGQIYEWIKEDHNISCFVNFSDVVLEIDEKLEKRNRESQTFEYPKCDSFKNLPMITAINYLEILDELNIKRVIVALSDNITRHLNIKKAQEKGFEVVSVIHPSALILDDAIIHSGALIFAGTIIGYKAEIFEGAIINTGVSIDHHSIIKECATIDPGVVMAGNVTINKYAYIYTNSTIINKICIGESAVVGAGSVVIKNISKNTLSVGIPAKVIKNLTRGNIDE